MRFTIRHLLWFTLLAAVGCWWWMPSANDAKEENWLFIKVTSSMERFKSLQSLMSYRRLRWDVYDTRFDFDRRDVIVTGPHDKMRVVNNVVSLHPSPELRSRGRGLMVFVVRYP